jgi:hypothetical protein
MSSPIHHASLVDSARHSPALLELIDLKLTPPVLSEYSSPVRPHALISLQTMSSTA